MDCLSSATTDADELNIDVQRGSGAKDNSGPFSSANHPISVAAIKPLSSYIDARFVFQTKHPPLNNQIYTHQCHQSPQHHLEVGSIPRL